MLDVVDVCGAEREAAAGGELTAGVGAADGEQRLGQGTLDDRHRTAAAGVVVESGLLGWTPADQPDFRLGAGGQAHVVSALSVVEHVAPPEVGPAGEVADEQFELRPRPLAAGIEGIDPRGEPGIVDRRVGVSDAVAVEDGWDECQWAVRGHCQTSGEGGESDRCFNNTPDCQ